jgi:hypothetical protein
VTTNTLIGIIKPQDNILYNCTNVGPSLPAVSRFTIVNGIDNIPVTNHNVIKNDGNESNMRWCNEQLKYHEIIQYNVNASTAYRPYSPTVVYHIIDP